MMEGTTFSLAFKEQVKTLCLQEFPCGPGPWRNGLHWKTDYIKGKEKGQSFDHNNCNNAALMSTESLEHLMQSPTYAIDGSLGKDVVSLQKTALSTSKPLGEKDLCNTLTTLRLVNKQINGIDNGLKRFKNLKELILSANNLSEIDGHNLPPNLEVLELCGNKISCLRSFNRCSCSLLHLGMSYNQINSMDNQLQPFKWKDLVSLDLSYNSISGLSTTVSVLQMLPKLRNVTLEGNAISLAAAYRGFIIDSLKELLILDDKRISADEKHHFRGLSKLPGLSPESAIVNVRIGKLSGIKAPPKEENEAGDTFPVKDYRYQIQYDVSKGVSAFMVPVGDPNDSHGATYGSQGNLVLETIASEGSDTCKPFLNTVESHWQEDGLEVQYARFLTTTNLKSLGDFLKQKFDIQLNEHIVSVGKDSEIEEEISVDAKLHSSEESSGEENTKTKKIMRQLPKTTLPSNLKDQKGKGRGKDKQEDMDFYEINRETKTIGKATIDLTAFSNGERRHASDVMFQDVETEFLHPSNYSVNLNLSLSGGKGTVEPKRRGREARRPSALGFSSVNSSRGKSAMNTRAGKGEKGGKGAAKDKHLKGIQDITEEVEEPVRPTIDIEFELISWKTAREAHDWIKRLPDDVA